jgi:alpha-glucuronidase
VGGPLRSVPLDGARELLGKAIKTGSIQDIGSIRPSPLLDDSYRAWPARDDGRDALLGRVGRSTLALGSPTARALAALVGWGVCVLAAPVSAEDGSQLWQRYVAEQDPALRARYLQNASAIVVEGRSRTDQVLRVELGRGLSGLLGRGVPIATRPLGGALIAGTPKGSPLVARLVAQDDLKPLGPEGFIIRSTTVDKAPVIVIASQGETGVLYGAFHFLRLVQTHQPIERLAVSQRPRIQRRILNHWDNLDGTIERGYAGASLWRWAELPGRVDPRLMDYARANASIGINGAVLNNVNADPQSLSRDYLEKTAAIAGALRPYGIRVYLSANFATPKLLGDLRTADPLDPEVARWWRRKADEIYRLIPDFGGFAVKANCEGQPGPQDYGRSHVDGANVLAAALAPHGGIVMWRAFVYYAEDADSDRVKRAYAEFAPLDGRFKRNVLVQVKNGPLDFQPREPFHPLFGAMPHTPLMAELQITQEYLGQATHLVYLAPMWKETLDADTYASGPGSLVAQVIDGSLDHQAISAIAGVANTGSDRNWCGHPFAQANWYAFGRLAWDHRLSAEAIAREWITMTWGSDPRLLATIHKMLFDSLAAYIDYTMPLGLHHLIGGDHYAPMPENGDAPRPDWSATYYHQADARAIGFDRSRSGSGAVTQYRKPLSDLWNDPATCPEEYLLWFHRLPWDHELRSGLTLWDTLVARYQAGAERAAQLGQDWQTLRGLVDDERHAFVSAKLAQQTRDARLWAEKCVSYFQSINKRPLPSGTTIRSSTRAVAVVP